MEIWKNIIEFNNYEISSYGNVRNKKTQRILKPWYAGAGYKMVWLGAKNKKYIHRLVGFAFIDNPNNYNQIDHIDRNKDNNNIDNLRWVTSQQNMWNQEHKNISKCTSGYGFNVNYAIELYNYHTKHFKNIDDAINYLEELKKKYPRSI